MATVSESGISSADQFVRRHPAPPAARGQETEYQRDVRQLVEMLSNLNPSAKEFVPSSYSAAGRKPIGDGRLSADAPVFDFHSKMLRGTCKDSSNSNGSSTNYRGRKNSYNRGNERLSKAEKEDRIRRTIYVSDIDNNVTEEMLATLFRYTCGDVLDCRVCGEPNSVLRFAFIEFADECDASAALNLSGFVYGFYPLRVLPSKTAILPVNKSFLPQSPFEEEMCKRTVYCTNIDKKVTQKDVKDFFETLCGEVCRLRLLGDHLHTTRIAFVEFYEAHCALAALGCSGMVLGSLPIRVSQSKTPVRPRIPRATTA